MLLLLLQQSHPPYQPLPAASPRLPTTTTGPSRSAASTPITTSALVPPLPAAAVAPSPSSTTKKEKTHDHRIRHFSLQIRGGLLLLVELEIGALRRMIVPHLRLDAEAGLLAQIVKELVAVLRRPDPDVFVVAERATGTARTCQLIYPRPICGGGAAPGRKGGTDNADPSNKCDAGIHMSLKKSRPTGGGLWFSGRTGSEERMGCVLLIPSMLASMMLP